jgi:hypothetical protein
MRVFLFLVTVVAVSGQQQENKRYDSVKTTQADYGARRMAIADVFDSVEELPTSGHFQRGFGVGATRKGLNQGMGTNITTAGMGGMGFGMGMTTEKRNMGLNSPMTMKKKRKSTNITIGNLKFKFESYLYNVINLLSTFLIYLF